MNRVNQVLIMAGGFGTRLGKELNPFGCKSLIQYAGQSMIGHLLDHCVLAGITNIIVATNDHSHQPVCDIVASKKIPGAIVIVANGEPVAGKPEFSAVPYELRNMLEDRFFMVCGHHPVSTAHIVNILDASEHFTHVFTAYSNNPSITEKTLKKEHMMSRIIITEQGDFREISLNTEMVAQNYIYVRNPYIVSKELIEQTASYTEGFIKTFSHALLESYEKQGTSLGFVVADMPPEFDYDHEYYEITKFLDGAAS